MLKEICTQKNSLTDYLQQNTLLKMKFLKYKLLRNLQSLIYS